ncbi:hypothetical protein O181_057439 [Austropuccinia psidii MF-1]|uniref:Uncharacterized protein n=1 Tax=Austropuccinia psidii MF-1 TaxID=1389203 RepID=A0A9Q3EAG3_9BASI|nr:hypothetical protein [Austropuccinia psidii MF-1]
MREWNTTNTNFYSSHLVHFATNSTKPHTYNNTTDWKGQRQCQELWDSKPRSPKSRAPSPSPPHQRTHRRPDQPPVGAPDLTIPSSWPDHPTRSEPKTNPSTTPKSNPNTLRQKGGKNQSS